MSAEIPTYEPAVLVGGDYHKFTKSLGDYPASAGWGLTYHIVVGSVDTTITGTAAGDAFDVVIPKTTLQAIVEDTTGRLFGYVALGSDRRTIYDQPLRVTPNPATASSTNLKTHAKRTLDIIEAALENRLTADMESYTIDGRAVTKIPIKELRQLRAHYAHEVWQEQNEGESGPTHAIEFTSAH